jgi:hypothetical protein
MTAVIADTAVIDARGNRRVLAAATSAVRPRTTKPGMLWGYQLNCSATASPAR